MITLAQARSRIGAGVVFQPHSQAPREDGEIVRVTDTGVFVKYRGDLDAKLTNASDLDFLSNPEQE